MVYPEAKPAIPVPREVPTPAGGNGTHVHAAPSPGGVVRPFDLPAELGQAAPGMRRVIRPFDPAPVEEAPAAPSGVGALDRVKSLGRRQEGLMMLYEEALRYSKNYRRRHREDDPAIGRELTKLEQAIRRWGTEICELL